MNGDQQQIDPSYLEHTSAALRDSVKGVEDGLLQASTIQCWVGGSGMPAAAAEARDHLNTAVRNLTAVMGELSRLQGQVELRIPLAQMLAGNKSTELPLSSLLGLPP